MSISPSKTAALRCLLVDSVAADVDALLTAAGVEFLLLKGPGIAKWLYHGGESRHYADVDVLVRPGQMAAAEGLLARAHFSKPLAEARASEHGPTLDWHSPSGVLVELHRTFFGIAASDEAAWERLAADPDRIAVGGRSIAIPSEPARCLLLALHAASHGKAVAQPIDDLALGLQRVPRQTWVRAAAMATQLAAGPAMAAGLRLVSGADALAADLGLPRTMSPELLIRVDSAPAYTRTLEQLAALHGARRRFAFVMQRLFPTATYMRHRYRLADASQLSLARAYLYRHLGLARDLIPSVRAWVRIRRRLR